MSNSLGDVRLGAVGLALLATGCLSSGEPLFTEDLALQPGPPPAQMPGAGTPGGSTENPISSVAVSPAPEQLFGAGRDVTSPAPGASDPVEPELPPGAAADEPAAPVDPCGLEGLILCDSFEEAAADTFPAADGWLPELAGC